MESISSDSVIYVLDFIGIIACATAATILAQQKRLDFFGCILVAMVGAIGGGTIRDVMLDRHPLFWMTDLNYVVVITVASLIVQVMTSWQQKLDGTIKLFDAIGLAAFSVIGLSVALSMGSHPLIAVMMGVLTSIAGGIMRDMICNEIPLVLRREIYISASIIGALSYFLLDWAGASSSVREFSMLMVIFVVRMCAIRFDWHLPSLGGRF